MPVLNGVTGPIQAAAEAHGVRATTVLVEPDGHGLTELAKLVDAGLLRPEVQATFDLADAGKAHELGELGRTRGKIVLTLR